MAQQISKPSIHPAKVESAKINLFFDSSVLIARRLTELLAEIEPAVLRLFLLFHLIFDLGVVFLIIAILGALLVWTIAHS